MDVKSLAQGTAKDAGLQDVAVPVVPAGGVSAIVLLADSLGVATVVALTVTFWAVVTVAGAVYTPAAEIVPTFGLRDQVTD
jgi:hypothetical protein